MKISVLCRGHASPHAGWVAIDELADLLVHYFDAELLSPAPAATRWTDRLRRHRHQRFEALDSAGGDVLVVVATHPGDLSLIQSIPKCRERFGKIYAWVTDSYHHAGYRREAATYDAITVTAKEDVDYPRERFGVSVHQLYQGADCLTWVPTQERNRDIDIIAFGRTPPSYQEYLSTRFHAPESPYLYLHSPLGHLAGPTVHRERGMLMKLLQRTRISLAFHLLIEPQGDRPRSMMVTSRWLESLLSGCLVAGKRPLSQMADDMLSWPGATVELDDDPRDAGEQLVEMLENNDDFHAQRRRNIREMIVRHDWRYRIDELCRLFDLPQPPKLAEDLGRLQDLAGQFS